MPFRDCFSFFEFTNSKFLVKEVEILSLETRNFVLANWSFPTRNFELRISRFETFEFLNLKFQFLKLKIWSFETKSFEF